jgi:trk system potassium uptake protein TrkH
MRTTSFQVIVFGFLAVILGGALLLMLPISSREGIVTPFQDALFTATSAVCVTGLVVRSTAMYWSYFGQAIILLLIQIGGMGVVTVAAFIFLVSGRKISLKTRSTMQEAMAAPAIGGIVRMTGYIVRTTILIEILGALLMMQPFVSTYGARGIWMAFFHSISAFCNAGFDLTGTAANPYGSLTGFAASPIINLVIMALIVIGGIGFLTWSDLRDNGLHFRRYRLQTKVVLTVTAILILVPTIFFFVHEYASYPLGERILASLFQAITPRTAGFNTTDLTKMSDPGQAMITSLMLIGGSPGSTAGGMKTTTVAVLFLTAFAVFGWKEDPHVFGRRIDAPAIRTAATILMMYIFLMAMGAGLISLIENLPISRCIFEASSAIGTVGLTLGITPGLHTASKLILIFLMFFGRVGGLTLIYATHSRRQTVSARYPQEKIMVG